MKAGELIALLASVEPWSPVEIKGAVLTREDLKNLQFKRAQLTDVTFDGCDLTKCWFLKCQLVNVRFVGSKLDNTDFSDTKFTGLEVADCSMQEASLAYTVGTGVWIESTRFDQTSLVKTFWKGVRAPGISFAGANATRATFDDADLRGASLVDANLLAVSLRVSVRPPRSRPSHIVAFAQSQRASIRISGISPPPDSDRS